MNQAIEQAERAGRRREAGAALALLGPASLLMLLMLVAPLASWLRDSLNRFDPTELMIAAVTPENYLRFFVDPFYRSVLVTTIRVSVIVTAACLALGLPMAWRLARSTSRWKSALVVLTVLPLFIGSTTRTAGWMILFAAAACWTSCRALLFGAGTGQPDVHRTGGDRRASSRSTCRSPC